jgi:sigma-B regulation protein RsbU (phosphoserine phosphatase)
VRQSDRGLFCTACYATIDTRSADGRLEIELVIGGHPLPILVRGDAVESLGEPGTLLGVFADPTFTVRRHTLEAGDTLVLYTDGLTDLPAPSGRTDSELRALLAELSTSTAIDLIHQLRRDLDRRVAEDMRADDVAMLVLRNGSG